MALPPTEVQNDVPAKKFYFQISEEDALALASDTWNEDPTDRRTRYFKQNSIAYRLRCIEGQVPEQACDWAPRDITWPDDINFQLNGTRLQPRLKLHYGKSLPIDVTQAVRFGPNSLGVFCLQGYDKWEKATYSVAIERVSLLSRSQVVDIVKANTTSPSDIIASFKETLNPRSSDDSSDDMQILGSTLAINLMDPIMAISIWEIPVRAKSCKHREAFDLDTFLSTVREVNVPDNQPSSPDKWFCPLCKTDARPSELLVDGYLVDVRKSLVEKGLLEQVKAIDVDENGVWTVRDERKGGLAESRPLVGPPPVDGAKGTPSRSTPVEVVDLSD